MQEIEKKLEKYNLTKKMTQKKQCKAIKRDGERCKREPILTGLCLTHYLCKNNKKYVRIAKLKQIIRHYQTKAKHFQKELDELTEIE